MRRKSNVPAQAAVGVFMVAVLLLLGYFTIVISGMDVLSGRKRARMHMTFEQIGGLKEHDSVLYRGTKVGTVERIGITPSNLVVTALVDAGVILRQGYRISVCSLSMLGGNYLQLEEGHGEPLDLGRESFRGDTPSDWMGDLSRVARDLRDLSGRLSANSVATNLESAITDFRGMCANMSAASENIAKASDGLELKCTLERANQLLENLNAVALRLKRGEGTVGRLTSDDGLYREIDGLIRDVRQVIDNYRDTTPISTFSSLAIGGF